MAFFFRPYPTTSYRLPNETVSVRATDITRRFTVANFINNSSVTFDEYYVQDGERPDTVAYDYYNDPSMDWLILLTNEIQDPYYNWPLSYENFNAYLKKKYGSVEYPLKTVHHYEKIIQKQSEIMENGVVRILPEKTLTVDKTTYLTLAAPDRKQVTIFEYEQELNEERRNIYLLDLNYLLLIKEQHPYIFDEGRFIR
jgi:hypothetical protein